MLFVQEIYHRVTPKFTRDSQEPPTVTALQHCCPTFIFSNEKCFCNAKVLFIFIFIYETEYPVDTRRRFNVYTTSIRRQRRLIDVV